MSRNQSAPNRREAAAGRGLGQLDPHTEVSLLRREHPAYEIQLLGARVWEAVSHPAPGKTVVHCAASLEELRTKIEGDEL